MTTPPIVSITDELIAELEVFVSTPVMFAGTVRPIQDAMRTLLAERAELIKTLSSLRWRLDDISDTLTARRGGDGESFYGLDEWSVPIRNLNIAIGMLEKATQ